MHVWSQLRYALVKLPVIADTSPGHVLIIVHGLDCTSQCSWSWFGHTDLFRHLFYVYPISLCPCSHPLGFFSARSYFVGCSS